MSSKQHQEWDKILSKIKINEIDGLFLGYEDKSYVDDNGKLKNNRDIFMILPSKSEIENNIFMLGMLEYAKQYILDMLDNIREKINDSDYNIKFN
jgi:hypothetical protein